MSVDFNPGGLGKSRSGQPKPVSPTPSGEETQQRFEPVDTQRTAAPQRIGAEDALTAAPRQEAPVISDRSSPITRQDIIDLLFQFQQAPSAENKQILSSMIQYGVPVSGDAIEDIRTLMKGAHKGHAIESAVVSYSKGLKNSKSVNLMSSFFSKELQLSQGLSQLNGALNQFSSMLQNNQSLFNAGLFTGLSSIISLMSDDVKKLNEKSKDEAFVFSTLQRGGLLKDSKTLLDFLTGLEKRIERQSKDIGKTALFKRSSAALRSALGGVVDALTSQILLSKEGLSHQFNTDLYGYWQIPNPMAQTQAPVTVLIKKEKKGLVNDINPNKTRIVLKFETPELGEVTIVIDLKENKMSYTFQTDNGSTKQYITEMSAELRDRMETLDYEMVELKTIVTDRQLDLTDLLLPLINLDKVNRIITEA